MDKNKKMTKEESKEAKEKKIDNCLIIKALQTQLLAVVEEKIKNNEIKIIELNRRDILSIKEEIIRDKLEAQSIKADLADHELFLKHMDWQEGRVNKIDDELINETENGYEELIKASDTLLKSGSVPKQMNKELKKSLRIAKEARFSINITRKKTVYQKLKSSFDRSMA